MVTLRVNALLRYRVILAQVVLFLSKLRINAKFYRVTKIGNSEKKNKGNKR